ncbi:MAG: hypothetical protein Q4G71_06565 [Pseudomonadota bacterium]|nr:hypothetical protein [Pseudomonadota bacterium]
MAQAQTLDSRLRGNDGFFEPLVFWKKQVFAPCWFAPKAIKK